MSIVAFTIHIDDLDLVLSLYDRIQVWRAATENGSYTEITAANNQPAQVTGTVAGPWDLDGKTLSVVLSGAPAVGVTFTGTDTLDLATVIRQVNAAMPGFASEDAAATGKVMLTSPIGGTASSITLGGNAAAVLGLSTTKANGKQARPIISPTTKDYLFRDFDGDPSFWYRIRYSSSVIGAVSDYQPAQQGDPGVVLPSGTLVTATVRLADATGAPIVGRRVIYVPLIATRDSDSSYGILPGYDRITATTDSSGKATVKLLKGMRVKVFFEGSNFNREFTVPDADFDVLQVATAEPDPLNIVQAPPSPIRMS